MANADSWVRILERIERARDEGQRVVVVCSALAGVTDLLVRMADGERVREQIVTLHRLLAERLGLAVDDLLERHLPGDIPARNERSRAEVLARGEAISSSLLTRFLSAKGLEPVLLEAGNYLQSDSLGGPAGYLSASCRPAYDPQVVEKLSEQGEVFVTQGFSARNTEGETVVLGRGGSDTAASYFAVIVGAQRCEIWSDVPGLFSADPRVVSSARLLQHVGYLEAQEIASTGAKMLHPRCIEPLRLAGIPLHILSTARPERGGTIISSEARDFGAQVKAIVCRRRLTLVSMETLGMWQQVGFLADAFAVFRDLGVAIDLVSTSEASVTVSIDASAPHLTDQLVDSLRDRLSRFCRVEIITGCASISLVGRGIRTILHKLGPALETFEERKVFLLTQASNDLNLSVVVEESYADHLVRGLHHLLIPREARIPEESVFGPTWKDLDVETQVAQSVLTQSWWRQRQDELLSIAQRHCNAYVYNLDTVRERARGLVDRLPADRLLYAMKANAHPRVLELLHSLGFGFDCVALPEIEMLIAQFGDTVVERILFTPNFAPRDEYQKALDYGVLVTIDNAEILREWGAIFRSREVFLRVDPGHGFGHHLKVKTAGMHSKFGVPAFELSLVKALADSHDIRISGLHAHIGSGLLLADNWRKTSELLTELSAEFPDVRVLDIGGGLGVPSKAGDSALDLDALAAGITASRRGDLEIWLEPGRYLVSEAGVLLTQVTQTKGKGHVKYVGVATGMNSLIRPALYGAYHDIVNLSKLDAGEQEMANVVGPICETGDILGMDRMLAPCDEGDTLLIANAGAYGAVMASRYNAREPAVELVLE